MLIFFAIEVKSTKARRPINQAGTQLVHSWKTNCPFELKGLIPINFGHWKQLQPEQVTELQGLFKSNVKPAQMLLQLQTSDNQTLATNKTITNMLQKFQQEDLDSETPIEALVHVLKETNWLWEAKTNDSGQIQNLFFAHPGAIHLAHINHHVALLDATYKTDCYKIPLLHIIGQAASN
ncbi:hypothetical protein PSTG_05250 [Puccinia striiformis f. sp. tritici PST-78]|uniref:Uncharacterized protein n=1 Tax=Puccinia striiformis f. sp. tritici PST-78 TaxID=1165861 RepID=A0A0L0VQK2_9BASI|nr:hypothetical protein PSTG_05250 [Puccinia striiformis f. sp. tritici PST-78]